MNFEQLQRFLVVADCLNFTAAAERLYIGQSTISRQIAALEQELGVVLLIRGPRSVELTEAGKLLQQEGTKLMKYVDEIKAKVVDAGRGASGRLRISTLPAYIPSVNEICLKMMETYPNIKVSLSYSEYADVRQDLDLNTADVGVSYSFLDPASDDYEVIPLEKSRFYVLCRKGHWIAEQYPNGIYLDILRDADIIFGRSSLIMTHQIQSGNRKDLYTIEHRDDSSMEGDLLTLQHSDSVIVLPDFSAENIRHNLAQIPLLDEDLSFRAILMYRKDAVSCTLQRFLEIVKNQLPSLDA